MESSPASTTKRVGAINLVGVIGHLRGHRSRVQGNRTAHDLYDPCPADHGTQFVLGKYCGLVFIGGLNIAIMFAMFLSTIWLSGNAIFGSLFQAVQLMWVEVLLVTALAMFFSTFSSPTLSAIMTLGFYVIGHLTGDLKAIAEKTKNPATESIMTALYYVCPNLEWLNVKGQAATGVPVSGDYQVAATAYGLLYAGLLLLGACRIFERRDF